MDTKFTTSAIFCRSRKLVEVFLCGRFAAMLFSSPPGGFVPAKKIISLVPSITELLSDLGLAQEVIGITKFCVHPPEWQSEKKRIGGTKNLHVEEIISIQPDLVIASREENVREQVEAIAAHGPVFLTDVVTIPDALKMITDIGKITGTHKRANELAESISCLFLYTSANPANQTNPTTLTIPTIYLIWKDPYMTVGGDTFISNMMQAAGFTNVYTQQDRYPEISIDELKKSFITQS
ncbi:MAG: hypothetical protein EOO01_41885, partial [Chitinophagaceae bacterium]